MDREPRAPGGGGPADRRTKARVGPATLEGFARAPDFNAWIYGKFRDAIHGDVMEVGSGIGNLSRLVLMDARRVVLTDTEPTYLDTLRRRWGADPRAEIMRWNLNEPPPSALTAAGPRFDAIVAVNVIEHLSDDHGVVRVLANLLRPGGCLLVYVPACPWAFGSLDVALGHRRRYTAATLEALLRESGLVPTPPRYMNRLGLLAWVTSGRILKMNALPSDAIALFNRVVGVARIADWLLAPLPLGLGLVARARKPETPQSAEPENLAAPRASSRTVTLISCLPRTTFLVG